MAHGRHAQGKGRHRAPAPRSGSRLILWVTVMVLVAVFAPVLAGLGLALGVLLGWSGRAITRN